MRKPCAAKTYYLDAVLLAKRCEKPRANCSAFDERTIKKNIEQATQFLNMAHKFGFPEAQRGMPIIKSFTEKYENWFPNEEKLKAEQAKRRAEAKRFKKFIQKQ